jgi:fibronectin-binding autotransporter adhesin
MMKRAWLFKMLRFGAALFLLLLASPLVLGGAIQAGLLASPLLQTTYTYTIVATDDSAVIMGDMVDTLSFVLTNTGSDSGKPIDYVRLDFDATYYDVSYATTAPAGWSVDEIKNAGVGQTYVVYTADSSSDGLAPNDSIVFSVGVVGVSSGVFERDTADQADELDSATVRYQKFAPKGKDEETFALQGGIASWPRRGLALSIVAEPPSVSVGGYITVTMVIDNRSTASQSSITSTLIVTPTGLVTPTTGSTPSSLTLASGNSGVITYTYQAAKQGTVVFQGLSANSNVTSGEEASDAVVIGNFTALLEVAPTSIVAGQDVTVRLRVYNNTGGTLGNVRSSTLGFVGDATVDSFSGPSPAVVASLPDGSTTTFEWMYTITGTVGSTYAFTGTASANGPLTTNVAQSNSGSLSEFSGFVIPPRVGVGTATPLDLVFTVANKGGVTISQIEFTPPSGFTASGGSGETIGSTGVPCSWNYGSGTFTPGGGCGGLPTGGTAALTITFSAIPSPSIETNYNFHVDLCSGSRCTTGGGAPRQDWEGAVDIPFAITLYRIEMEADPTSIAADGVSTSVITATVYEGSTPLANADVVFATTGTEGTLSSYGGTTDANGVITVTFTSPVDSSDSTATIIATYLTTEGQVSITLTGVTGPNPQYVGGSLSPVSVMGGDTVTFGMDVINTGGQTITLTASSTFTFTDGTYTFSANLSAQTIVPPDTTRGLTLIAAIVSADFAVGSYPPVLHLVGAEPGQTYDRSTDQVTVTAPPATVQFSSASYSVGEGGGSKVVTATLSVASGSAVTVDYATSDGTAISGSDYTAVTGTLTFPPGVTVQTFTVPITDDLAYDPAETITLTLSNPANATLGTPNTATLTIVDNEWPVYQIEASAAGLTVVVRVRLVDGYPEILSWRVLP